MNQGEDECPHDTLFGGMCVNCGKEVSKQQSYHNNAAVSHRLQFTQEVALQKEREYFSLLRSQKRLVLVLDIDNTLIHSVDANLRRVQQSLTEAQSEQFHKEKWVYASEKKYYLLQEGGYCYKTKARKHLKEFLEGISELYDVYLYTHGTRPYALLMVKVLEQEGRLFKESRLITRDDCNQEISSKTLTRLFSDDRLTLIVDDRNDVWRDHLYNLYKIGAFFYFADKPEQASINHMRYEVDLGLIFALHSARLVHSVFFSLSIELADIKLILPALSPPLLQGLTIYVPTTAKMKEKKISSRIQGLGGKIATSLQGNQTQIIAIISSQSEDQTLIRLKNQGNESIITVRVEWLYLCERYLFRFPTKVFEVTEGTAADQSDQKQQNQEEECSWSQGEGDIEQEKQVEISEKEKQLKEREEIQSKLASEIDNTEIAKEREYHKERIIKYIEERERRHKQKKKQPKNGHNSLAVGLLAQLQKQEPPLEKKKRIDSELI